MKQQDNSHGVFISYRRSYAFFAGRIHDYLQNKGFCPYMDVYRMRQDNYMEQLVRRIDECPYFLLVLSKGCFDGLSEDAVFLSEIEYATEHKDFDNIIIVADDAGVFPGHTPLPKALQKLEKHQCDIISHSKFNFDMENLVRNIDITDLNGIVNWREYVSWNGKSVMTSRSLMEHRYATLENRFGKELLAAVKEGKHFEGTQIIKQIRMSCYAANILFNPTRNMVDDKAYDNGVMFNIMVELLRDPDFSLEIIINAPNSAGAKHAAANNMLGNSAWADNPGAVFYAAYAGIIRLIAEVPEFKQAYQDKRFRFYLTDVVMNGAIFQIEYKEPWKEFDHIKYDIYNYNLSSNMDRRCVLVFCADEPDNYTFLANDYNYLKANRYNNTAVAKKHDQWMQKWKEIMEG